MKPTVKFSPKDHRYFVDGRPVPSVTTVLPANFDFVKPEYLKAAAELGTAVHKTIELYELDQLDIDNLDDVLRPYLDGWINFKNDTGFVLYRAEMRLYSVVYGFDIVGTTDVVGTFEEAKQKKARAVSRYKKTDLCLIDIKSGILSPTTALQTAAYSRAYEETTGDRIRRRFAVQLGDVTKHPRGYKLTEFKNQREDFSMFLSFLNCHNWKTKNHVK